MPLAVSILQNAKVIAGTEAAYRTTKDEELTDTRAKTRRR
tara:strand:- start:304 stop:423 length:120 start_codon:yes stop_codon:yes gene_type:complete